MYIVVITNPYKVPFDNVLNFHYKPIHCALLLLSVQLKDRCRYFCVQLNVNSSLQTHDVHPELA